MYWLTIEFYRSLLSDVANYIVEDYEIAQTIAEVEDGFITIHEALECDERFALAVL